MEYHEGIKQWREKGIAEIRNMEDIELLEMIIIYSIEFNECNKYYKAAEVEKKALKDLLILKEDFQKLF